MVKTLILIGAGEGLGNAVAKEFESLGIEVSTHTGDASQPETLTNAIKAITDKWGNPDALVYNIGVTTPEGDQVVDSDFLMKRYQIDAASAWHSANLVATKEFGEKKGAIIFTGGGFAKTFQPILQLKALCIDKAALNAMNIILHEQLKPLGIFVGSVIINGVITKGDEKNDPSIIAKQYWKMYNEQQEYQVLY